MMSAKEQMNTNQNDNPCVVCFKNVVIYSVGVCNHAVCFECSTRMRVLCRRNECPICRQDLPKVIFTKDKKPFSELLQVFEGTNLADRKFGILFSSHDIQKEYHKILEHRCQICGESDKTWPFKTFTQLKDHMRREHCLFYCEICVENLKIFTFERRCYNRQELAHHRRKGDPDNTSHRGHPLCEFCDTRYIDNDELFRHLRRQHFFCHFCDADGKHLYYVNVEELRQHFAIEHYLCEEGECKGNPLTAVFRSDIDLKAHVATEHSRHLSKSATKQARTLELEFTLAPRSRVDNTRNKKYDKRDRIEAETYLMHSDGTDGPSNDSRMFVASATTEDFPVLAGTTTSSVTLRAGPSTNLKLSSRIGAGNFTQDDFPSLGGGRSSAVPVNSKTSKTKPDPKNSSQSSKEDFPVLSGSRPSTSSSVRLSVNSQNPNTPKVSIQVDHQRNGSITTHITTSGTSQRTTEAFPAFGKTAEIPEPQWISLKSKKAVSKKKSPPPPKQLSSNSLEDFPSLAGNSTLPQDRSWVNKNVSTNRNKISDKQTQDSNDRKKSKEKAFENNKETSRNNVARPSKSEPAAKNDNVKTKNGLNNEGGSTKPPPGFNVKPPPGLNIKPPPGLNPSNFPSLNSIANDFTFTSSSGQSYSITPSITYHPPNNFQSRNHKLIQKAMQILDKDTIKEFKTYSDLFRNGAFPVTNYYEHCKTVLKDHFEELFPELLVLLPDMQKQQELFKIYGGTSKRNLVVCENCGQIIYKKELSEHYNYHVLDHQFPSLAVSQQPVPNAWR